MTLANRLSRIGVTVFSEMSALALQHGAINLGQGFPDFSAPEWILGAATEAIDEGVNQYAISHGAPALRQQLAARHGVHLGRELDPDSEIVVTSGATEAIFTAVLGLIDPGDEAIVFEPYYDSYVPAVQFAGGRCRYVPLRRPEPMAGRPHAGASQSDDHVAWWFDPDELAAAFTPATKLVLLNTPHNPTGKVFSRYELQILADLCQEWDVYVLSDEVYEHIIFDDGEHVSMASLPGMWDRTLTVSSAGKTFSVTGWKIGWAIGPPQLSVAVRNTHQYIVFCSAAPLEEAVAVALAEADERDYYAELRGMYQHKRDLLVDSLRAAALNPYPPQGTYFVLCDISHLGFNDDVAFCRHLTTDAGVAAIPPSVFYSQEHQPLGRQLVRFSFCKDDATLDAAGRRLLDWRRTGTNR